MQVELIAATPDQEPILSNLLELYLHDFSEFHNLELDVDGRFGYPNLGLYWSDPDRHAFLLKVDGKLAGLALVKKMHDASTGRSVWDMAEFFVVRGCRRNGIGTRAAREVWQRFPGPWQVRVMQSNISAFSFWQHAIQGFTGKVLTPALIENDGQRWHLFSFDVA
jgi:predicted acetyltransferase